MRTLKGVVVIGRDLANRGVNKIRKFVTVAFSELPPPACVPSVPNSLPAL